jgi:hypothetical protein
MKIGAEEVETKGPTLNPSAVDPRAVAGAEETPYEGWRLAGVG